MQNKKLRYLLAAAAGTATMTLFSHFYSRLRGKQFREPVLLGQLLAGFSGSPQKGKRTEYEAAGLMLHYLTGLAFTAADRQLAPYPPGKSPAATTFKIGLLNGMAGVAIWKATLKMHPHPPKVEQSEYFMQLVAAHVIFALTSEAVASKLRRNEDSPQ